jgi:hypothetical protein
MMLLVLFIATVIGHASRWCTTGGESPSPVRERPVLAA